MMTPDCIDSLYFQEWEDRRSLVKQPFGDTGEWIWRHESFLRWTTSAGVLWIKGKPGSGKSTIARMITDVLGPYGNPSRLPDSYAATIKPEHAVVADFFYSARMGERATRHFYMLRSILYQILSQNHSLYPHYRSSYRHLMESGYENLSWGMQDFKRVFENIVEDASPERPRVCCVLDGFDESDDCDDVGGEECTMSNNVRLLSWLSNLAVQQGPKSWLKIIVLSRPAAGITRTLGGSPSITVEEHNQPAIQKIVDDRISSIRASIAKWIQVDSGDLIEGDERARSWEDSADRILGSVRTRILERADGTIQWVVLVLKELQAPFDGKGVYTLEDLEAILDTLPRGLEELYQELIKRLKNRLGAVELIRARCMLTWVCFARRPLSLEEFRDALALSGWQHGSSSSTFQNHLDRRRVQLFQRDNWAPLARDIVDTCGCLLEVVRPASALAKRSLTLPKERVGPEFTVQVTHQTAKEFLVQGDYRAKPLALNPGEACHNISNALFSYLYASMPMPDATPGRSITDWEISDFESLARHLQDRPLFPYIIECFQRYHMDDTTSSRMKDYIQALQMCPEEHGWQLLQPWLFPDGRESNERIRSRRLSTATDGARSKKDSYRYDWQLRPNLDYVSPMSRVSEPLIKHLFSVACRCSHLVVVRLLLEPPFGSFFERWDIVNACLDAIDMEKFSTADYLINAWSLDRDREFLHILENIRYKPQKKTLEKPLASFSNTGSILTRQMRIGGLHYTRRYSTAART